MRPKYKKKSKRKGEFKSELEHLVSKKLRRHKPKYEAEKLKYFIPKNYIPDFIVETPSGNKIHIEVKGWFRSEDQQKMRAVKTCNPELDIRMYFPNNNKVQGSKMTNSEWCVKYEFPYAIGNFPRSWFR